MTTLTLFQTAAPDWVGPTVAISLVVIAVAILAMAVAVGLAVLRIAGQVQRVGAVVEGMQDDLRSSLTSVRRLTEQGQDLVVLLRNEAGAFAQSGRRMRRKMVRGMDRMESKLADLETLYDVVHEEVEDTALDVAAALRSVRAGNGVLGRVRRLLVPPR
jgi:hypothetical protein